MRRMRRATAVAMVVGLALAGCSSGGDDVTDGTDDPTPTTTAEAGPGTTTAPDGAPTAESLEALALTGAELGPGWEARALADDGSVAPGCLGEAQAVGGERTKGQVEYTDPADDYAALVVELAGDDASDDLAAAEEILDGCQTVPLGEEAEAQGTLTRIDLPTVGDGSAFYELSASGEAGQATAGFAVVTVDGYQLTLFYGISSGPDRPGFQAFAEKAVDKVRAEAPGS